MQGKRREDTDDDRLPPDMQRGDYWYDRKMGCFMFCSPNGGVGSLIKHQVTEHEDSTITVAPSILLRRAPDVVRYHGFLERGVWIDV